MLKSHFMSQSETSVKVLALLLLGPAMALGQLTDIYLKDIGVVHPGFRIAGEQSSDYSGSSVSGAGDVNGDGLSDLVIGSPFADAGTSRYGGAMHVVFGKEGTQGIELNGLGSAGFKIEGIDGSISSAVGACVSGAGDTNGDGLCDVLGSAFDPSRVGTSFVVFGKADSGTVPLASIGARGASIRGADQSGLSLSGAGDVNGDGYPDVIIGAPGASPDGRSHAGACYVVFCTPGMESIDPVSSATNGFMIAGARVGDALGNAVSGAGDVNGDGLADVIVGASEAGDCAYSFCQRGRAYVIFGKPDNQSVDLAELGNGGFQMQGVTRFANLGGSVSGAGDVNGDGLADVIVGAHGTVYGGNSSAGAAYVIYGKTDGGPVDPANLAAGGFVIGGADLGDFAGFGVAGAGDFDGDGFADVIVGAFGAVPDEYYDPYDRYAYYYTGETYIVFGKPIGSAVAIGALGAAGLRIVGPEPGSQSGRSVSGAGDVDGDGVADVIIGASSALLTHEGASYVVFSPATPPPTATYRGAARAGDAPPLALGLTGDGSNDSTPDSRCWIDFSDGLSSSSQTVVLHRSDSAIAGLDLSRTADVMWQVSTDRAGWSTAALTFRPTDAELNGLTESRLRVYAAPSASGPWSELPSSVDTARNRVSATTTTLGYFALVDSTADRDGIPPNVEEQAPNGGDGNNDGMPDSEQSNVASFPNGSSSGTNAADYLTLVSPDNTQLSAVVASPAAPPFPTGVTDFPVGIVSFRLEGPAIQPYPAATIVKLIMEHVPNPPVTTYLKVDGESYLPFNAPILSLGASGSTGAAYDGDRTWTISLTDVAASDGISFGESGDSALTHGSIQDPGGPAVAGPLLVTLASFTATSTPFGARLDWTTTAEINTAGFNLYRASATGLAVLNQAIIPPSGVDGSGASYSYWDSASQTGSYYLEDVDLSGTKTLHGPVVTTSSTSSLADWTAF